jgi:hypothetical protein
MATFPIQSGGFTLGNQITPGSDSFKGGTHFSHWGVGGWVEVPDITGRNDIPIQFEINTDGYGSGRRKIGMIVYTMAENKFFQLLPRHNNGNYITTAEWQGLSNSLKLVALDPIAEILDEDTFELVAGSGNPNDCWTELCLSCGELQIIDVFADKTFLPEDANKIFHFHTTSTGNLNVSVDSSCPAGFNVAVNNVGTGFLLLNNSIKSVSNVIDAQHSGAFIYVKGPSDVYAVGRL